jgi:hypothetical protein
VGNFGGWAFLASLVALPILLAMSNAERWFGAALATAESYGVPNLVSVLVLLIGIGWIAIEGARLGRHVGASPWQIAAWRTDSPLYLRLDKMSPLAAQIAYEWQRKGRLLPALTMGFVAFATFFFVAFADYSLPRNWFGALGFSMIMFPVYAAPIAAVIAGVLAFLDDYRQRVSGVGTFLFTRAADSRLHSRARLIMSLKTVGMTIGSCLIVMGVGAVILSIARPVSLRELYQQIAPFSFLGIVMIVAGYVLMVWTLYWMAIPGAILWFWVVAVMIGFELVDGGPHPFLEFMMIWPPSLAMIGATILVAWRNVQNRMLFPWAVALAVFMAVTAWCVIAWLGSMSSAWDATVSHFGLLTVIAGVLALSLCPAFPILAQPMLVERLRRG